MPLNVTIGPIDEKHPAASRQLLQACIDGNLNKVKDALKSDSKPTLDAFLRCSITIHCNPELRMEFLSPFIAACVCGHAEIVEFCLQQLQSRTYLFDINYFHHHEKNATAFHLACLVGHDKIVKALLTYTPPAPTDTRWKFFSQVDNIAPIKLNSIHKARSPLAVACENGHVETVRLLIWDKRFAINGAEGDDYTPLYLACSRGNQEIMMLLLTHTDIDVLAQGARNDVAGLLSMAVSGNSMLMLPFFYIFFKKGENIAGRILASDLKALRACFNVICSDYGLRDDPSRNQFVLSFASWEQDIPKEQLFEVIRRTKKKLLNDNRLTYFALIIFISDRLLQIKNQVEPTQQKLVRFLKIATQLPMELQMVLSHRVAESMGTNIFGREMELPFRQLAARFSK